MVDLGARREAGPGRGRLGDGEAAPSVPGYLRRPRETHETGDGCKGQDEAGAPGGRRLEQDRQHRRTREQLVATSTVIVLIMAALGGNLFPRFLMPESLQNVGQIVFNAWALDGYQKVFWYDALPTELAPELAALALVAFGCLALCRMRAARWRRVG